MILSLFIIWILILGTMAGNWKCTGKKTIQPESNFTGNIEEAQKLETSTSASMNSHNWRPALQTQKMGMHKRRRVAILGMTTEGVNFPAPENGSDNARGE